MTDAARPIAVETLLAERPWVEALARSLVVDDSTADDVVQQTWLAAVESPPRSSPRGWLSRVVRNAAFESRRRATRRERWESMATPRPADASPAEVVAKAEAHRQVVDAVMSLDEPYRAAVLLRFFEGLESDEVARRTGVPVETARTRIKRALALLRGRLDRDHRGDGRSWVVVLLPLTKRPRGAIATGGTAMAVSTKTVVAAAVAVALLGALAIRATTSPREKTSTSGPPAKATADAPRPIRRERRALPTRDSEEETSAVAAPPARAVDEKPADAARVTVVVLMPDGAPATAKVLIRFRGPQNALAHPADWWWSPTEQVAPAFPGTWTASAVLVPMLRSKAVEFTTPADGAVTSITLRLEPADAPQATSSTTQDPKIAAAIDWLRKRQSDDGHWLDPCATGLTLLCFLGAGETHQSGASTETVQFGLKYLLDRQDAEGCFVDKVGVHWLKDDAVAALAMIESYGMSGSRTLKEPAQRAVAFALNARSAGNGWGKAPSGELDLETSAWMVMLAKSAQMSELDQKAAKPALDDAVTAIDRITDHATGRVSAVRGGGTLTDEAATAVGVMARLFAGHTAKDDDMIVKGAALLADAPPVREPGRYTDYVAWYFGTLAMFQVGGDAWQKWNAVLKTAVIDRQRAADAGDDRGSWDQGNADATSSDRVWATAFNLLCTEVYLRYERMSATTTK